MSYTDLIKPELLVLIPVLYFIGTFLKSASFFKDNYIPAALGGVSAVLCIIYLLDTSMTDTQNILYVIFSGITQGILIAGTSVYANQIYKQLVMKEKAESENNGEENDPFG